jgi:hypothetical protein
VIIDAEMKKIHIEIEEMEKTSSRYEEDSVINGCP